MNLNNRPNIYNRWEWDDQPKPRTYKPFEKWLISISCVSLFPMIYVIGKAIINWIA